MDFQITLIERVRVDNYTQIEQLIAAVHELVDGSATTVPDEDGGYHATIVEGLDEEARTARR